MKKIVCLMLWLAMMFCMAACASPESTSSNTEYVLIALPGGGVVEGLVSRRLNLGDGVVSIQIGDTIYRTHYENVVVIEK